MRNIRNPTLLSLPFGSSSISGGSAFQNIHNISQFKPEHIRQYQAAMFTQWKLAPNTVSQRLAALRFF